MVENGSERFFFNISEISANIKNPTKCYSTMNPASDYLKLFVEKFHKTHKKTPVSEIFTEKRTSAPTLKLLSCVLSIGVILMYH